MPKPPERKPFSMCALSKCRAGAVMFAGYHDGGLCEAHASEIWHRVEYRDTDSCDKSLPGAEAREYIREECRAKRKAERRKPTAMGEIYYVEVSGLIKVGWTTVLANRIRSYGPTARLLANYPGSRADEANLHRQLTPSRAKGREWYHDDPVVRAFVAVAVRQYGPPRFEALHWTTPKQVVAGKRHR